jgi:PKD repeat protein
MIYFIADGVNPVPYSDIIASENGLALPIPANGSLVAFMINDITEAGGNHGTLCASAVAGQGVIASGRVTGTAPNAKIIAVGNIYQGGNDLDEYYFAVEGYDGIPGTGDEAQIVSCSFGDSGVINLGWDFTSRFVDNLTTFYAPNVTFSVASGNGGYGYGTVVSPGSSMGAVTVGAALNARNTEVVYWSNRGPNAVGQLDPDVVSVGVGAFGDQPLNQKNNGNSAYQSWSGTSLATPVTAGILALIYDAYSQANGDFPSSKLSREIIMSTADNLNYDPLVQGAGFSNATRAVLVANNTSGILLSPTFWTAGDYRGTEYDGFANILHPGDSDNIDISISNKNQNQTMDVNISDYILSQSNMHRVAFNSNKSELDGSNNRPDYFITLHDSVNNISHIPNDTALLKVSGFMPYDQFDKDMNYNQENRFTLTIYNWRDTNGNGSYWNDSNSDGVAQVGEMEWSELSSIVSSGIVATTQEARMHDPLTRITDGLVVGVFHRKTGAAVQFSDIYIQTQTYNRTDWDWLDTNPSFLSIAAHDTSTFSATLSVPPQTPIGLYEGMIVLNESENESTFPVIVNVAGSSEKFTFGGNTLSTDLYANDQIFGGFRWGWRYEGGDWRFYFTDIPDSYDVKPGTKLIADVKWENYPTDIDVFILGGADDQFSDENPGRFGPYTLDIKGRSANQYIWAGKFRFNTTTGSTQEIIASDLSPGLNEIILHNVLYSGQGYTNNLTGEMGTVNVTPYPWDLGFIDNMNKLSATQMFTLLSSFNLTNLSARAYGVYPPMEYTNEFVYQNDPSDETTSNWSRELDVVGAQYIKVNTSSQIAMDIDLFLLKDDGDGIPEWSSEEVASSTSPDDEEEIIYNLPSDGKYWVFVHGWNIPVSPSLFDCYIEVVYGNDINVTDFPAGPIMKNENVNFNASVVLPPLAGEYRGVIKVQLEGLYETIEIPFLAELESEKPIISDLWPPNGTLINLTQPEISAQYFDSGSGINTSRVYIYIDGVNQTQNATITNSSISIIPTVPLSAGNHTVFLTVSDNFQNTDNVTWTFIIELVNPILNADAGIDKNSIEDDIVSFSANLTTGENDLENFTWDFGDDSFGYGPNPSHAYPSEGTYIVILTVTDIANNTDSDSLNVFVSNLAPVADAGTDQVGFEGDTIFFDAGASTDTPSDIPKLNYYWYFEDGSVLNGISVNFVFTDNGNYTVTLIAEDDNGLTDSDIVYINISNVAPIADIGGPYSGLEGSPIDFIASAFDPGSDTLTFEWNFDNIGTYDDATGLNPKWIWYDEGNYQIGLKVTDDEGDFTFDSVWVTVSNVAPIANCGGPYSGMEGTEISIAGSASDPGMDTLTYTWDFDDDGNYNDGAGFDPKWTWDDNGVYTIGLMVSDGDGGFGYDTTTVAIENSPPYVDIGESYSGSEGIEISFASVVTDIGALDTHTFLWDFGDGHTSSLENPTHIYSDNGEYTVTLTVTDSDGGVGSATATCSVSNLDPEFEDMDSILSAPEDQIFRLQIIASDVPEDTITYSDESDLIDINSKSGEIEFTPTNSDVGEHDIKIVAKDEDGGKAEITFTIMVQNKNDAPILSQIGPQIAYEDQEFILIVKASDPDSGDDLAFFDDSNLFDINSGEGFIYFIPTNSEVGVWTVTISVSDESGATDSENVMFTIVNINDAPVLESITAQNSKVGETFTYSLSAYDDDDPTLTYSDDSQLFVIDPILGTISFTPKRGDEGIHTIHITVTDQSGDSDTKILILDIEGLPEPEPEPDWFSWILLILIILVVLILLFHLFGHKKDEEEDEQAADENIEPQETEDEMGFNDDLEGNNDGEPLDQEDIEEGELEGLGPSEIDEDILPPPDDD